MILAKIASPSRSVHCEVHGMSSPRTCTAPHLSVTTSGVAIYPAPSWQGRRSMEQPASWDVAVPSFRSTSVLPRWTRKPPPVLDGEWKLRGSMAKEPPRLSRRHTHGGRHDVLLLWCSLYELGRCCHLSRTAGKISRTYCHTYFCPLRRA